jgi:hypothetical protein
MARKRVIHESNLDGVASLPMAFGGAMLGIFLHSRLPERHLATDTKEVVRLAMGLVGTTVALALGLLVGSAKGSFGTKNTEIAQLAAIPSCMTASSHTTDLKQTMRTTSCVLPCQVSTARR